MVTQKEHKVQWCKGRTYLTLVANEKNENTKSRSKNRLEEKPSTIFFSLQPCLGNLEASNWVTHSYHVSPKPMGMICPQPRTSEHGAKTVSPNDVLLRTMEGHTIGKDRIISNAKVVHIWAKLIMLGPGVKMFSLENAGEGGKDTT